MRNNTKLHSQSLSRRAFILGAGKLGLLSLLASKMFYMQLIKKDQYKTLSDKNRINLIVTPPYRGKIYDVEGRLLATNESCFRLLLNKNNDKNYTDELELISQILNLTEEMHIYIWKKIKNAGRRIPIVILDQLNWKQISLVEEQKLKLTSIFIDTGYTRAYPASFVTSHLIGYIGQLNEHEKQEFPIKNIEDFNIGKSGVEKYYETKLRGEFGYKQMEVNAYGKYIRELSSVNSISGSDIHLNIDSSLQEKILPHLNKQGCSAIVMDCTNGNIIMLAATPVYEPNNFAKLSKDYWNSLINDPYKPLFNKAIQSTYPPGSVFKLITILAALEAGISQDKIVNCAGGGASFLGTNSFRCSSKRGHGAINMLNAIKSSCNIYMYEIAKLIGADKIIETAKKFGFGAQTGIDLPSEAAGFVPSREWRKKRFNSNWTLGDSLNLSIGQGFLLVTPIQLTRFTSAIANDGKLFTPRICKNEPKFEQINIKPEHLKFLREAMYSAVNKEGGTAYSSRILDVNNILAGKTGTSQVQAKAHVDDDLSRMSIAWERRNHAVFIGFAPYDNPTFSITVFVDHGGAGGRAGAPIASRIAQEMFNKYN